MNEPNQNGVNMGKEGGICLMPKFRARETVLHRDEDEAFFGLAESNSEIGLDIKIGVYEFLKGLRKHEFENYSSKGHRCGALIILGYVERGRFNNGRYARPLYEDIFRREPRSFFSSETQERLKAAMMNDLEGAVLISPQGNVLHTGYYIDVNVKAVLDEMKRPNSRPLVERCGFLEKVATKHINAYAGSYMMPNTLIYTLREGAEETRIRVFEKGKIIMSPIKGEIDQEREDSALEISQREGVRLYQNTSRLESATKNS